MAATKAPTEKQMALIEKLAGELGIEADVPATRLAASALIDQLMADAREARFEKAKMRRDFEMAGKPVLEAGRREVQVIVKKARWNDFGQIKALCEQADGNRIWMSIPKNLLSWDDDPSSVTGLEFKAVVTVEVKDDDPHFGFGSRPAKGEFVAFHEPTTV